MKNNIKLKMLLTEDDQVQLRDKIPNQELADHFRAYLHKYWENAAPDLWSSKTVADNPGRWDDLNKYWQTQNIFQAYCQDPGGYEDYIGQVGNTELEDEMTKTNSAKDFGAGTSYFFYIIAAVTIFGAITSMVGIARLRKLLNWGAKKYTDRNAAKTALEKTLTEQTVRNIPEEKLYAWVEQQRMAALNGSKQKLPKWAYDDLAEQLALADVKSEVHVMVFTTCMEKVKLGTMNAETLIKSLPNQLKTGEVGAARIAKIRQIAAKTSKAKEKAASVNRPRPKPRTDLNF